MEQSLQTIARYWVSVSPQVIAALRWVVGLRPDLGPEVHFLPHPAKHLLRDVAKRKAGIYVFDNDEETVDFEVAEYLKRHGLLIIDGGGGWSIGIEYRLTQRGRVACDMLGYPLAPAA